MSKVPTRFLEYSFRVSLQKVAEKMYSSFEGESVMILANLRISTYECRILDAFKNRLYATEAVRDLKLIHCSAL